MYFTPIRENNETDEDHRKHVEKLRSKHEIEYNFPLNFKQFIFNYYDRRSSKVWMNEGRNERFFFHLLIIY